MPLFFSHKAIRFNWWGFYGLYLIGLMTFLQEAVYSIDVFELDSCDIKSLEGFLWEKIDTNVVYISQLVIFARCCTSVPDFHSKNLQKLLPNCWHRVTDITCFEKHLQSSSGNTLTFIHIWWNIVSRRDLSKLPHRRQGPEPHPLLLWVGTPSVLGPKLASRRVEHSLIWRMSLYIFDILFLSPYMFV